MRARHVAASALVLAGLVVGGGGIASAADPVSIGGGSPVVIADRSICTVTAVGTDDAGRSVGLTAGHCGGPGDAVAPEWDRVRVVGRVVRVVPDFDTAVIEFVPGAARLVAAVGETTIAGVGAPPSFGDAVCKQGRSTGRTCGLTVGDVLGTQQAFSALCVGQGDSGAPVVEGDAVIGMVNAYLGVPCVGPAVVTTMESIVREVTRTGGPGAGFRPIGQAVPVS
ncbi:serine protease [Rhodococcoides corynebacterioides]|uniref:serine protease n=1 Tax=Rhodococcoides corynebacterioides TaxID=53972 RepID=UPI003AD7FD1F